MPPTAALSPKRARREMASGSAQAPRFSSEGQEPDPLPRRVPDRRRDDADPREPPRRPEGLPRALQQLQREHPLPNDRGNLGDATPYHVLRAQQLLEGALPFLEQETANVVAQAHSLLFSWTTSIWGVPIVLVNSSNVGESPNSLAETIPWQPPPADAPDGGTIPDVARETLPEDDEGSQLSHRRRRLHAAFDNASGPSE